ncbi:hypothetical protein BJV78DRAFT_111487 [Lactifluus subvellereus]|nr:hypothetical protein BJV78DRAFT_111487 [Lactifluus subvellereus]
MKVTAHQDACKLIAIVDHISKVLKDARPEDSNTMAQAPTLRRRVPELSWAIERFNDAIIPEPWKFEIERRCPSKLLESLKSPDAVIIDLLTALKHTLSGLSVAFSIYIQPISHFCSRLFVSFMFGVPVADSETSWATRTSESPTDCTSIHSCRLLRHPEHLLFPTSPL